MHIRWSILFVFSVIGAYPSLAKPSDGYCHDCVHYNFEEDFSSLFKGDGICSGLDSWVKGKYSSIDVEHPSEHSQSFIMPKSGTSCSSSFPFAMKYGGSVHVRVYIDPASSKTADELYVFAARVVEHGENPTVGVAILSSTGPDFVRGWQTLTLTLQQNLFDGQVSTIFYFH